MVESVEDTDKMQENVDKMQLPTVPSKCNISLYYDLVSEDEL